MVANRVARSFGLLCLATGALGCAQPDEPATPASVDVAAVTENGFVANGFIANGLTENGFVANGFVANGFVANGLTVNGFIANGLMAGGPNAAVLEDPLSRQFLKYVVSCALSSQQSLSLAVDGTTYTFPGGLGLAPQWGMPHGSCDGSCQRWVSACVLARVDAAGIDREISVRGFNLALATSPVEISTYTKKEATYFGNLFIPGQPRFLCLAPGQKDDQRVCGDSLADCPMTVVGSCPQDCALKGPTGEFALCSDAGRSGAGQSYFESISVFLPK
jgi:hypothetical protein